MAYKNPIDPVTGKPKRGRPKKVKPVDAISSTTTEVPKAPTMAAKVVALNPDEEVSTSLREEWRKRMSGTAMMDVPREATKAYPEGQFCWCRETKEDMQRYRSKFGYEVASTDKPLPGQTDTAIRFGDTILMVRGKELKRVHDEVRRDQVLVAGGQSPEGGEGAAEQEAIAESRRYGYGKGGKDLSFFEEDESEGPLSLQRELEQEKKKSMNRPGRARMAGGTKYVFGGINK